MGETRIEPALDRRTTSRFDEAGRVLEAIITEGGRQVELVRHDRDAAGRIVTTRRETDAGEERWEYDYVTGPRAASVSEDTPDDTPDDRLRTVRFEQNDEIVSVTTYEWPSDDAGQPTRQADYYRDGAPYLRVHFRGDTRVREQVLRGRSGGPGTRVSMTVPARSAERGPVRASVAGDVRLALALVGVHLRGTPGPRPAASLALAVVGMGAGA